MMKIKITQNCGVMVKEEWNSIALSCYGVILHIIELHYIGGNKVVLFRCDWYDTFWEVLIIENIIMGLSVLTWHGNYIQMNHLF